MAGQQPRALTADEVAAADRVIVLGREAKVDPVPGMRGSIEVWDIDEPSLRGIDGAERMELIVSEIATRVEALHAQLAQQAATPHIRVFEPALCCNTGVCGTDVDDALVAFTADLEHLKGQGVDIERHNLANDPTAFAATPAVSAYLQMAGSAGLPLVLVDDVTVATGRYPDRAELRRYAGLSPAAAGVGLDLGLVEAESSSSCSPASGCC